MNPLELAGIGQGFNYSSGGDFDTAGNKTATALDIINSIGQIVLGGILISRTPKEQLPRVGSAPQTTSTPVNGAGSYAPPAQSGFFGLNQSQLFLAAAAIVLIIALAFSMRKAG